MTKILKKIRKKLVMTKQTNKILLGVALGIVITLMLGLFALSLWTGLNPEENRGETDVSSSNETIYVVKDFEEKLAVFKAGNENPITVYDFYISNLPDIDVNRLRDGIIAYSQAELQQIIEDFTWMDLQTDSHPKRPQQPSQMTHWQRARAMSM